MRWIANAETLIHNCGDFEVRAHKTHQNSNSHSHSTGAMSEENTSENTLDEGEILLDPNSTSDNAGTVSVGARSCSEGGRQGKNSTIKRSEQEEKERKKQEQELTQNEKFDSLVSSVQKMKNIAQKKCQLAFANYPCIR